MSRTPRRREQNQSGSPEIARRNGWLLYAHPAFLEPFIRLRTEVERISPQERSAHPKAKLLRRVLDLVETEIPADPNSAAYQLGNTLGPENRHWRRAKFFQRFRLFFRFHSEARIIVFAWLNDEGSLRRAGDRGDVYEVFRRRLQQSRPPGDWEDLRDEATGLFLE